MEIPKLSIIVAGCETENDNLGIGFDNNIPWTLSKDIIHFKNTTTGHFVLMGFNTWLSIPNKPLQNRINIVVTSKHEKYNVEKYNLYEKKSTGTSIPGFNGGDKLYDYVIFVPSLEDGIKFYLKMSQFPEYERSDLFIVGGESIYNQVLKHYSTYIDKIFLTRIDKKFTCNKYFDISLINQKKYEKIFQAKLTEKELEINFSIQIYHIYNY